jgi:hypothetical protein
MAGSSHHWLVFFGRCAYFLVGSSLLYAAVFMYEGETDRLEDKIARFWVEISERARVVGSKTVAFINAVAALDTRILNRIFGEKLFSLRMIGMSTTLSLSVLLLAVAAIERGSSPQGSYLWISLLGGIIGLLLCALGIMARPKSAFLLTLLPLTVTLLFFLAHIASFFSDRVAIATSSSRDHWSVPLNFAFLISISSDVAAAVIIRRSIRSLAMETTARRIWGEIMLQFLSAAAFVCLPLLASIAWLWNHPHSEFGHTLGLIAFLNISTAFLSVAFAASLGVVLAHKALWPLLERLLYPLARWPVLRNRKLLVGLSFLCFIQAFHPTSGFVRALLDVAAK